MATKSAELTSIESGSLVNPRANGRLRFKSATINGGTAGQVLRFFRVRSNDCIKELKGSISAAVGSSVTEVGLHDINTGSEVDADEFAAANQFTRTALTIAGLMPLKQANPNQLVWEGLGLTSDPGIEYDVTITLTTMGSTAGDITLSMYYNSGD